MKKIKYYTLINNNWVKDEKRTGMRFINLYNDELKFKGVGQY